MLFSITLEAFLLLGGTALGCMHSLDESLESARKETFVGSLVRSSGVIDLLWITLFMHSAILNIVEKQVLCTAIGPVGKV